MVSKACEVPGAESLGSTRSERRAAKSSPGLSKPAQALPNSAASTAQPQASAAASKASKTPAGIAL